MSETAEPEDSGAPQRFDCTGSDADQLTAAADAARQAIERGECIVLPTDTVYGIGADAFSPEAVQRLLDAKLRGRDMPPPVLIGDPSLIRALATDVPAAAKELVARHWPGPLTVILKIQPSLRMDLGDAEGTIALRVPDHDLAREILRRTGPMAVSSANLSGKPAAVTCDEALDQLGASVAVYLDGGAVGGPDGAPSTIIDFTQSDDGEILRTGALSLAVLRETVPGLADLFDAETDEPPASPEPPESTDRAESDGPSAPAQSVETVDSDEADEAVDPDGADEADEAGESVEFDDRPTDDQWPDDEDETAPAGHEPTRTTAAHTGPDETEPRAPTGS